MNQYAFTTPYTRFHWQQKSLERSIGSVCQRINNFTAVEASIICPAGCGVCVWACLLATLGFLHYNLTLVYCPIKVTRWPQGSPCLPSAQLGSSCLACCTRVLVKGVHLNNINIIGLFVPLTLSGITHWLRLLAWAVDHVLTALYTHVVSLMGHPHPWAPGGSRPWRPPADSLSSCNPLINGPLCLYFTGNEAMSSEPVRGGTVRAAEELRLGLKSAASKHPRVSLLPYRRWSYPLSYLEPSPRPNTPSHSPLLWQGKLRWAQNTPGRWMESRRRFILHCSGMGEGGRAGLENIGCCIFS